MSDGILTIKPCTCTSHYEEIFFSRNFVESKYHIECLGCNKIGKVCETESEAIEEWNRMNEMSTD